MTTNGIRLGTDGACLYVLRLGFGDRLSPPFRSPWDLRGWLICRGYTAMQAASFIGTTVGPMPPQMFEGPVLAEWDPYDCC